MLKFCFSYTNFPKYDLEIDGDKSENEEQKKKEKQQLDAKI